MNKPNIQEKPCVVPAKQGFSVSYKERFLYSKYNPSKLIIDKINSLEILPGTIFLCNSSILEYGLIELYQKLPENCLLFLCEFDLELHELMENTVSNLKKQYSLDRLITLTIQELYSLPNIIHKTNYTFECGINFSSLGLYKRFIRIDFSAGVFFNEKLFLELETACVNSIKTFWSNRVTLVKFGRKYSYNFLRNLKKIISTIPIESFFNTIEKPIIVFGAGQSLENDIAHIQANRKIFFILCADTALQPLIKHKITPDAVFLEEAQNIIKTAFLGTKNKDFHLFAGLSSIPELSDYIDIAKISYFTSLFTQANFIENLRNQNLLPFENLPFGSVGITTMYYATKFRKDDSVPIFYYGLDFSYSAGHTHAKNTIAHIQRLSKSNRINQVANYTAAFSTNSLKLSNDNSIFSTPILMNYKALFEHLFSTQNNIFKNQITKLNEINFTSQKNDGFVSVKENIKNNNIKEYFENEKNKLQKIKNILTGKENIQEELLENTLTTLITSCDYLYLHFPDGWMFSYTQSFLNRVRSEIDFFLKLFE